MSLSIPPRPLPIVPTFIATLVLLAPLESVAGPCEEKYEDCVEDCRIEFGMEVGRQQLFKCLKRCESGRGDCVEYRKSERDVQLREADRSRAPTQEPELERAPAVYEFDDAPPVDEADEVARRSSSEDALPEPRPGEERALVRIEGPREKVVGLANVDELEMVLHSGKQLGNDRMAVSAWASPGAITEAKSRGCRVRVLMSAEKVRASSKRAPKKSASDDFEWGMD